MTEPSIEHFLETHAEESFAYSDELKAGLEAEEWKLTSYTGGEKNQMQAKTFVDIYGKKAKQLNRSEDEYSKTLQNDLIDFCTAMEKLGEEIIDVWSFSDGTWFISVFVARGKKQVVAALKTKS